VNTVVGKPSSLVPMKFIASIFRRDFLLPSTYASPPPDYTTPSWPGLYNPLAAGVYLYVPSTIWKFTLYWTLLLEGVVFMSCGLFASFTFSRSRKWSSSRHDSNRIFEGSKAEQRRNRKSNRSSPDHAWIPLHPRSSSIITTIQHRPQHFPHPRRPLSAILLPPILFSIISAISALISGTLAGWAIAALYNAAFLRMSTWVPALWSAGMTLIIIISSYPNFTTIL
ncbi:hypothetical protein O181_079516, partial [Austropuccinia psidii MF-1]|nr:hypothetical protein [Austropuccinia psidii MF-1]